MKVNLKKLAVGAAGIGLALAAREMAARLREEDLTGRVALVTGSSRGLGFAIATELGRNGCRLAICGRDPDRLEHARQTLERLSASVFAVPCNIADEREATDLIERVERHYGAIDILVNNAGIIAVGPLANMTPADFREAMDTNFWGTVYPTLAVLPHMRTRQSGSIANITSIGGKMSVPHLLPYSCSKFAAVGFSEGLRAEASRHGIHVTTVVPGLLRTGSPLNATFKGNAAAEYSWFSVSDGVPGLSMSAEQAAKEIVRAIRRRHAEKVLTLPAFVASKAAGVFPGAVADVNRFVNALLPADGSDTAGVKGRQADQTKPSRVRDTLTKLTRDAAEALNQNP